MRRWLPLLICLALLASAAWAQPRLTVIAPSPELAAHVRAVASQAAPRLQAWTGAAPSELRIEVAPKREDFQARAAQLGGPQWAAGLALPLQGLILLRSPRQLGDPANFREVLIHEMVHLYLAAGLKGRRAPLWLEEGLAMQLSGEGGWGLAAAMTRAVLGPGLLPLSQLERRFPPGANQASLAYAQSYYVVGWLLDEYGDQALRKVVHALSQDRPLTAALQRATGHSLAGLEERFQEAMEGRFSWLSLLTAGGVLWALVALLAGVGLVIRRRGQKKRMARGLGLEEQERLQGPPRQRRRKPSAAILREAGLRVKPEERNLEPGDGGDEKAH